MADRARESAPVFLSVTSEALEEAGQPTFALSSKAEAFFSPQPEVGVGGKMFLLGYFGFQLGAEALEARGKWSQQPSVLRNWEELPLDLCRETWSPH